MDIKATVKEELEKAARSISTIAEKMDDEVVEAVELLYNCTGKVVVTGMGKTGIIARKVAATLSSTGTTSIFLHAAEGIHGDLGILRKEDVVIAISYSGNTEELLSIIPYIRFHRIPIIAITGNQKSNLAQSATVVLNCNVPKEFEPFGMVPTMSTTVALALGDAIAVALLKKRNFTETDFVQYHPGGTIGKRLLLRVEDLMHTEDKNPLVNHRMQMDKVIIEMTSKGLGCTSVCDSKGRLVGIVTDGDLRRFLSRGLCSLDIPVKEVMTPDPKAVLPKLFAVDALRIMEDAKITMLPVINEQKNPIGMLHMHDLINAGVVG